MGMISLNLYNSIEVNTATHFRDKKTEARGFKQGHKLVSGHRCKPGWLALGFRLLAVILNCLAKQKNRKANKKRRLPYVFSKYAIYFPGRDGKRG